MNTGEGEDNLPANADITIAQNSDAEETPPPVPPGPPAIAQVDEMWCRGGWMDRWWWLSQG